MKTLFEYLVKGKFNKDNQWKEFIVHKDKQMFVNGYAATDENGEELFWWKVWKYMYNKDGKAYYISSVKRELGYKQNEFISAELFMTLNKILEYKGKKHIANPIEQWKKGHDLDEDNGLSF